jgi:penicillin-binding protein 2
MNPFPLQDREDALRMDGVGRELVESGILYEKDVAKIEDGYFVGKGIRSRRMALGFSFVLIVLTALLAKAAWMQLVLASSYQALADENRFRVDVIPGRRGIIRDRTGLVLAENIPSFDVRMRWLDLPGDEAARDALIAAVGRTATVDPSSIRETLQEEAPVDEWIDIAKDVGYEQAVDLAVALPDMPGVALIVGTKRRYPESAATPSLSHLLGYVGAISPEEYADRRMDGYRHTDDIGKTGLERSYESRLRGETGLRRIEVDALGRPRAVVDEREPVDGEELVLTVDAVLQKQVEEAVRSGLTRAKAGRGSAVVMNVEDGSLLAAVSWPAYDNNIFTGRVSSTLYQALIEDPDHPLFPRAWAGQFPSGSTIKPLIAAAALQEDIVKANTLIPSTGGIRVGPWFFPDWAPGGHGMTNVRRAIAWSINSFFYYVGAGYESFRGLGIDRLVAWMSGFGLGRKTGLDLPGEVAGLVPDEEWKVMTKGERWYIGDTYNLSIGQGDLLVTPLQMTVVTAMIANGGNKVIPHVVQDGAWTDTDRLDVRDDVWRTVRLGMRDTVTIGSARTLSSLPVAVAGKTGTAQWRSDRPNHSWFTGFAPADDPRIAVTVLLEEGDSGSQFAVPVAGEIFRAWYAQTRIDAPTAP